MENLNKRLFCKEFLDVWHSNFLKFEAFCRRQPCPGEPDEELARWMSLQRSLRHMLPVWLREKLLASGFNFEAKGSSGESMHRQLAGFVRENGHAWLPDDWEHEVLKDWLIRQILNKGLLTDSQLQRLDRLGVDWDIPIGRDHRWQLMYARLKAFYAAFGHCRVPQGWAEDRQLALWVTVQRRRHLQDKLRPDRGRLLSEIGFVWDFRTRYEAQWNRHFLELVAFHKTYGHCHVPGKQQQLSSWVERQRILKAKNLLLPAREEQLNGIGFTWRFDSIKKENWLAMFKQLCAYRQEHGHVFVPVNYRENKSLGIWVGTQRWLEAQGRLGAEKKRRLSELGFVWSSEMQGLLQSAYYAQWEANFAKLKAYRQVHGTCHVSLKVDPALQRWTRWQRLLFYQGKLSAARIDRLNEIRFPWSVQESYWMGMYDALVDFRRRLGHTRVPSEWGPNPRLAAWVYRTRRDKEGLTTQKVELLDGIGFDWSLRLKTMVPWSDMYGRLLAFQREHGHTRVPVRWQEDRKLGKWVARMRHERERLDLERVSLLQAIGFDWGSGQEKLPKGRKEHIRGLHPA